mgnify:CR=1 FL=1
MGRPLSRQQLFNANSLTNIKVHFHNGSTPVKGYILRQRSTKWFLCSDVNGNTAKCKLVDKVRADLLEGEMNIAFVFDDGTKGHAIKISRHLITVMYDGMYRNMPWTFDSNNADGRWQIDEAGTNESMANDTDVGGEDVNGDYPVPGSGTFKLANVALGAVTYADKGTPYSPGGNLTNVTNATPGLWRRKYDGNFCAASNTAPASWNYSFFDTATFIKAIADEFVSWGQQSDGPGLGEHNFSMEWKGYVQAPESGNFNLFAESDDHIAVWIGTAATNAPANASRSLGSNNKTLPAAASGTLGEAINFNSVTLIGGQWYPIRIWFSEFTGGCKAQFYMQAASGTKYDGDSLAFAYNSATHGF